MSEEIIPLAANTGAISYKLIDDKWHYTKWPESIVCIVEYEKYKKANPDWQDKIDWKECGWFTSMDAKYWKEHERDS